jgi:DNA repair protein RecO (recombination protein O)
MEILKTTGIALSSHVSGEADIICTYYTRDSGKRKFLFKGLKKSKKRSLSATEPGSVANIVYYFRNDRDTCIVNDVTLEKYHSSITSDLQKIFHLYFILETVEKTCGYEMADESIFKLLLAGIEVLSKTDSPPFLTSFLVLHLLKRHGLLSEIHSCRMCSKEYFESFTLDVADLRPVCGECLGENPSGPWQRSALLPGPMKEYIQVCMNQKFSSIYQRKYSEKDILDLLFNLSLFIENYFHTELKSKSFIFSDRYR